MEDEQVNIGSLFDQNSENQLSRLKSQLAEIFVGHGEYVHGLSGHPVNTILSELANRVFNDDKFFDWVVTFIDATTGDDFLESTDPCEFCALSSPTCHSLPPHDLFPKSFLLFIILLFYYAGLEDEDESATFSADPPPGNTDLSLSSLSLSSPPHHSSSSSSMQVDSSSSAVLRPTLPPLPPLPSNSLPVQPDIPATYQSIIGPNDVTPRRGQAPEIPKGKPATVIFTPFFAIFFRVFS